jgi:hypothetical protein
MEEARIWQKGNEALRAGEPEECKIEGGEVEKVSYVESSRSDAFTVKLKELRNVVLLEHEECRTGGSDTVELKETRPEKLFTLRLYI